MRRFLHQRLFLRLAALSMLILCLILVNRKDSSARLTPARPLVQSFKQKEAPTVLAANEVGTPLIVASAQTVSSDSQSTEIAFQVTNVFSKPIRAFAIKQDVEAGGVRRSSISLCNLDLSNLDLRPNQSMRNFSTFEELSEKRHQITLSAVYVEFSDGTSWGIDSDKSAERIQGQRAAGYFLSTRLIKDLNADGLADVIGAIDAAAAKLEPPANRSEEWKQGFLIGRNSLIRQLKQAQNKRGLTQVNLELHQLAERFKGAQ